MVEAAIESEGGQPVFLPEGGWTGRQNIIGWSWKGVQSLPIGILPGHRHIITCRMLRDGLVISGTDQIECLWEDQEAKSKHLDELMWTIKHHTNVSDLNRVSAIVFPIALAVVMTAITANPAVGAASAATISNLMANGSDWGDWDWAGIAAASGVPAPMIALKDGLTVSKFADAVVATLGSEVQKTVDEFRMKDVASLISRVNAELSTESPDPAIVSAMRRAGVLMEKQAEIEEAAIQLSRTLGEGESVWSGGFDPEAATEWEIAVRYRIAELQAKAEEGKKLVRTPLVGLAVTAVLIGAVALWWGRR